MTDTATTHRTPAIDGRGPRPPGPILRNRNFILLWCAYTTSALGDHLSEMALLDMQQATARDDSTRISAIIMFTFMLPFFLFGPAMGWLADRLPRKWIMITADVIRAALMLSMAAMLALLLDGFAGTSWQLRPATGTMPPLLSPWLYALPLLATGVFAAMFSPARAAMLPTIIRTDQIVRGNGLMNAMGPIASIASFLIGAQLVARYGAKLNFQVDGLTFLASATLLLFIKPPRPPNKSPRPTEPACVKPVSFPGGTSHNAQTPSTPSRSRGLQPARPQNRLIDGLRYCRSHRLVIELIAFTVLFWSAAGVLRSVIPALVGHVFGGDIKDIGYFTAALGIGMLFGAMTLAFLGDALRSEIAISWSLVGAGLASAWLAAVYAFTIGQAAGYAGLFTVGMFGSGILVSANALLQKSVPDFFRGRVFGIKDLASIGGLLLATGCLAIPRWESIDRQVPWMLIVVGLTLSVSGVVSMIARQKRSPFGPVISFWLHLTEFHNRLIARVRRDGPCTITAAGPVILAANHNCVLDPFLLISTMPHRYPGFLIAREYTRWPVFGRLTRMIGCIPVNRTGIDIASVRASLRHLAAGRLLGIFPQGRIRPPDDTQPIHEGIGMLALRSGATVIPVHIATTRPNHKVVIPFFLPQRAVVRYGPPIDLSPWKGREKDRTAYGEVACHIMDRINALRPTGR